MLHRLRLQHGTASPFKLSTKLQERKNALSHISTAAEKAVAKGALHDANTEASHVCLRFFRGKQPGSIVYTWASVSRKFSRRFNVELKRWIETVQNE
jgi:hypothetical protein